MQCEYFSYLLVPFAYRNTYDDFLNIIEDKKNDKDVCIWRRDYIKTERFYEHIDKLIAYREDESSLENGCCENLGHKFVLDQNNGRSFLHKESYQSIEQSIKTDGSIINSPIVPAKKNDQMSFIDEKGGSFNFSIEDIELYIFENNIAFINYKVKYYTNNSEDRKNNVGQIDVDQLIDYIYRLKKLYSFDDKNIELNKKIGQKECVKFHFSIASLTKLILESTNVQVETFFESKQQKPRQALVYTGILLQNPIEKKQAIEYMFYLRNGFRHNYNIPVEEYDIQSNEGIYHAFQNIYWGASMEGCGALAFPIENNNQDFITKGFLDRVQQSYFYIYLLSLNQRYSLIKFSIEAACLPNKLQILDKPCQKIKLINELKEKIVFFNLKWMFKHLANISHYTKFYELIKHNLRIGEALEELELELSTLSQLIQFAESEIKEKKEDRKEVFNTQVAIISFVFIVVQTTGSLWPLIEQYDTILNSGPKLIYFIVTEGLLILLFGHLIIQAIIYNRK